MTDDIIKNFYEKYMKNWFKKNYKFLLVILIYALYQSNFLISLISLLGLNIYKFSKALKLITLFINDIIYLFIILIMFKNEFKEGIKKIKKNPIDNSLIAVKCWTIGCLIMIISSALISMIIGKELSGNEEALRQNIKMAPAYMFFTCSIMAPFFEELVFRRSLYQFIKNRWILVITSGMLFGLLHIIGNYTGPLDLLYIIPYGAMGSCFAYLLSKTKNITLPIMIHMIHNTILVTIQIIGG